MDEIRKLLPRVGSYVWETDYFQPNWQDAFWGENYARLRAIKDKYDPDGLFFLHHGVGSEDWSADGFAGWTESDRGKMRRPSGRLVFIDPTPGARARMSRKGGERTFMHLISAPRNVLISLTSNS